MNSIAEIKSVLHHQISTTDDIKTLAKIQTFINELLVVKNDTVLINSNFNSLTRKEYTQELQCIIDNTSSDNLIDVDNLD